MLSPEVSTVVPEVNARKTKQNVEKDSFNEAKGKKLNYQLKLKLLFMISQP